MSKTQSQPQSRFVSLDECKRMRERFHGDGASLHELCDEFERAYSTVRRHTGLCCRHDDRERPATVDDVIEAVGDLAETLDPPRVPSQTEWRYWDNQPCSATVAKKIVGGSWASVLHACGYPEIPRNAAETFRVALYANPEIMEVRR